LYKGELDPFFVLALLQKLIYDILVVFYIIFWREKKLRKIANSFYLKKLRKKKIVNKQIFEIKFLFSFSFNSITPHLIKYAKLKQALQKR